MTRAERKTINRARKARYANQLRLWGQLRNASSDDVALAIVGTQYPHAYVQAYERRAGMESRRILVEGISTPAREFARPLPQRLGR